MENKNVYKGHRYVPKIMGVWDELKAYEGLSIVTWEGVSYTSKKRVPEGVEITNEEYWVVTGNYNAQVETYREEVREFDSRISDNKTDIENNSEQVEDTKTQLEDLGINVRNFGVIPNDSNIDNHDAIISALDYATEHDIATLQFPAGETYTSPISLQGYQYIKFKGQSGYNYVDYNSPTIHKETSIRFIGSGEYGIQTAEPVENGWSATGISFEDITLNGDKKVKHVVNGKYNTVFKNFVARGAIECGIVLENQSYPVKLTDTHANFNGSHGLWVRSPYTTVYSVTNSEFSRNDGYGMLLEGGAGSSFKNVTVQDNKQGGVKINSPDDSTFTHPVYLQTLGFDTLYTEANGQYEPTHPKYEGNWALLIAGVGSVQPRKMTFTNSTINQSATGGTIKVDYGEDIYFDLNTTGGKTIEINRDTSRVMGVRFAPVSYSWQSPTITYYGDGESGNVFPTPYRTKGAAGYNIEGAWVGTRGRTTVYEFFRNDALDWGLSTMETQSGNKKSYHVLNAGSILMMTISARNRSAISGKIRFTLQKRRLNNGSWETMLDDKGELIEYVWDTNASDTIMKRFPMNTVKLTRGEEFRVNIEGEGHALKDDNDFTVNLLVEY